MNSYGRFRSFALRDNQPDFTFGYSEKWIWEGGSVSNVDVLV